MVKIKRVDQDKIKVYNPQGIYIGMIDDYASFIRFRVEVKREGVGGYKINNFDSTFSAMLNERGEFYEFKGKHPYESITDDLLELF